MPMAGEGSRFLKEGWTIPKPLIKLRDIPLFKRAINSIPIFDIPVKHSFIVRQEHIDLYKIDSTIKEFLPDANIFSVQNTTRGAVETCLLADSVIDKNDSIVIMDCDFEFISYSFLSIIREILSKSIDEVNGGVLVSFDSNKARYSYAEIDESGFVKRTVEKEVISNHALCGAYFFSSSESFLNAAHSLLKETNLDQSEFYVSLLYNILLKTGEVVRLVKVDKYCSYGTPEELNLYL